MAAEAAAPPHVLEYLREHETLTLATASPRGFPHASTYMYANDGLVLYFWARPDSTTAKHIEQNPVVGVAIDSGFGEGPGTRGIQATGECRVVLGGSEMVRVIELFSEKFPALSSTGSTTNISFFRIAPIELHFVAGAEAAEATADQPEAFGFEYRREVAFSAIRELPEVRADVLAAELQTIEVPVGEVVAREGAPADKLYIVVEGALELLREERDGPRRVGSVAVGQLFGEMAIFLARPRSATVKATEHSKLMVMDAETFRKLVAQSLAASSDFDAVLRDRLSALEASGHA